MPVTVARQKVSSKAAKRARTTHKADHTKQTTATRNDVVKNVSRIKGSDVPLAPWSALYADSFILVELTVEIFAIYGSQTKKQST